MTIIIFCFAFTLAGALAVYKYASSPRRKNEKSIHVMPREMSIALGQTVAEFMRLNNLQSREGSWGGAGSVEKEEFSLAIDTIIDIGALIFSDHWIHLNFMAGPNTFDLGDGRVLFVDQQAGKINSFNFTPSADLENLSRTLKSAKAVAASFSVKGWKIKPGSDLGNTVTDEQFSVYQDRIYVQMVDSENNLLTLTVMRSQREVDTKPARAKYALRIGLYWANRNQLSYGDLIYPRRIYVHGNQGQALPLRAWIEDPNWTPAQHGMKFIGGTGEQKKWSSPR